MSTENSAKLAVLIDADNASADIVDVLLEEIAKYGIASVKRIYGDWSSGLKKWKDALLPHAITPVQQFAYTKGKNATDMAMVIDAMDLLYSNTFDGFCIVSSDSDFTRLASRIRENGLTVYGFGQKKTPEAFRKACDKFIYTENLLRHAAAEVEDTNKIQAADKPKRKSPQELKQDSGLMNLIRNAVKEHADDDGWASLGVVGQYINKVNSDFDARNWGYAKLSSLIRAIDLFETQIKGNHLWLRTKKRNNSNNVPLVKTETRTNNGNNMPNIHAQAGNDKAAVRSTPTVFGAHPESKTAHKVSNNYGSNAAPKRGRGRPPKNTYPAAAAEQTVNQNNPPDFSANSHTFKQLIPLVQQAIAKSADADGWATVTQVTKQLLVIDSDFIPQEYGFDTIKQAIGAIYQDWVETKKVGRGERVRINKRYGSANSVASTPTGEQPPLKVVIPALRDDNDVLAPSQNPADKRNNKLE
ncbi:NYN domain-containing protein [Snodgrassella sp. CFCC 13594]|uniref:NYN domain-containing protein n=1 Tax=Snodgrassella sp. CFCC 13594 TaxID=1775559 RepID=UPI0009EDD0E6|nr:NYN domain-containing protein [Snodgrassella sp. CFCC 13594]